MRATDEQVRRAVERTRQEKGIEFHRFQSLVEYERKLLEHPVYGSYDMALELAYKRGDFVCDNSRENDPDGWAIELAKAMGGGY